MAALATVSIIEGECWRPIAGFQSAFAQTGAAP